MGGFKMNTWYAGALKGAAVAFCLTGLLVCGQPVRAGEFSDMQQEFNSFKADGGEFESYKAQIKQDYAAYKTIIQEEFATYRGDILKVWDKAEVSTKKTYVGYSPDYKVKKVVDYDKGVIRISAVVPASEKEPAKVLEGHLKDLMTQNAQGAYKADQFTAGVEKKLKKKVDPSHLQEAEVGKKPIVGDMVTGKPRPTAKEIEAFLASMMGAATTSTEKAPKQTHADVVTLEVKIPATGRAVKANAYLADVKRHAAKRGVDPALVFAVMETESAFNPMARSYVPAYGLMQIVPKSAGRDASKVVLGKDVVLSPSYLYNGGNNIAMGVAYLYILNDRYLASVKNPKSRLYCVIAAYNTGAGNVARAFIGSTNIKKAAKKINTMPPEKVYKVLIQKLPHKETRDYLQRVSKRMPTYQPV